MPDFKAVNQENANDFELAAIDLGSNSFHMVIGRHLHGEISISGKLQEKVQLAAGLDGQALIDSVTWMRAMACLQKFAQRIAGLPKGSVRVVGTNALRIARNAHELIAQAESVLGHPIEIISGREEARLIYLGVAHTLADDAGNRLVVDIGGGSTEFIIGNRFEPIATESLHMGCVSYGRFFPEGIIKPDFMEQAILAARLEVQAIASQFQKINWQSVVGASGTIRTIEQVLIENKHSDNGIHFQGLQTIKKEVLKYKNFAQLKIPGLKADRKSIFVPGLAILLAVFEQLGIRHMTYSDGALREGLLYDQLGRFHHEDVRDRTINALHKRYSIDTVQAGRVEALGLVLLEAVAQCWELNQEVHKDLLRYAAQLHEIGMAISHSQFHKHGAYLVQHADLAGFSNQEKLLISLLIRCHRRKLNSALYKDLSRPWRTAAFRLTLLLRLAVLLNHARIETPVPTFEISVGDNFITLVFPQGWLAQNPLLQADLQQEKQFLKHASWELEVK